MGGLATPSPWLCLAPRAVHPEGWIWGLQTPQTLLCLPLGAAQHPVQGRAADTGPSPAPSSRASGTRALRRGWGWKPQSPSPP